MGTPCWKAGFFATHIGLELQVALTRAWLETCSNDSLRVTTRIWLGTSLSLCACFFSSCCLPQEIPWMIWKPSIRLTAATEVVGGRKWFQEVELGSLRGGGNLLACLFFLRSLLIDLEDQITSMLTQAIRKLSFRLTFLKMCWDSRQNDLHK